MSDPEKLREAIQNVRAFAQTGIACADGRRGPPNGNETWVEILAVCHAAESTLPKTKMANVWRVEFAQRIMGAFAPMSASFTSEAEAVGYKSVVQSWANTACIRVTGPHQQEVPQGSPYE